MQERGASYEGGGSRGSSPSTSKNRFSLLDSPEESVTGLMQGDSLVPGYFGMLPNGDIDHETYEDEKEWDMDDVEEGEPGAGRSRLLDKREASQEVRKDGKMRHLAAVPSQAA